MFSLTWPAYMQIYCNKRKRLHKKRVQLPEDWFGTPTWPPFHCFRTPIWPPWRHVKTLYSIQTLLSGTQTAFFCCSSTTSWIWEQMLLRLPVQWTVPKEKTKSLTLSLLTPLLSPCTPSSQAFSINVFSVTHLRRKAEISLGPRDPKRIGQAQ